MITIMHDKLVIELPDASPAERRDWLVAALAAHLRHYAANPHKRARDDEHAIVLAEFLEALAEAE